jgi:hypothetical protein
MTPVLPPIPELFPDDEVQAASETDSANAPATNNPRATFPKLRIVIVLSYSQ